MNTQWEKVDPELYDSLEWAHSKVARQRGNKPQSIYILITRGKRFNHVACQYLEPGKWERWVIRRTHQQEIRGSWSDMMDLLRPLICDRAAIEIYPRETETVNHAPVRHFWILPDGIQPEFDLRD